jgi:hypothetical protein
MPQRNSGAVTIEDVARAAGRRAAEQLVYVPDPRAGMLATGRGDAMVTGPAWSPCTAPVLRESA